MMTNSISFDIAAWHAWAPGVVNTDDWMAWLAGKNDTAAAADNKPDIRFVPPLLRRRLDRLGRMALGTAGQCLATCEPERFDFVFASRHGSLERMRKILTDLTQDEPLSPTGFSLSVHNAIAGIFSIACHNHNPSTAVAAGVDTLALGLLEAAMLVGERPGPVILTYAEDNIPPIYTEITPDGEYHPFAISLALVPGQSMQYGLPTAANDAHTTQATPELALMRMLLTDTAQATLGVQQPWSLERARG